MSTRIRRAFVDVPHGQVHYASCGDVGAPAVLLLHQTPRSWREYAGVLPLLGERFHAIAMDTAGFGDSAPVPGKPSVERWAEVAVHLLDALGLLRVHVVGHHTGGVIAVELAAAHGRRVQSLVLSSTPYTNEPFRVARAQRPPIDHVDFSADGEHLAALWRKRQGFYPAGKPELLQAFVADALRTSGDVEGGHRAVASYRMEDKVHALAGKRVLLVHAPADPFASPHTAEWRHLLPRAEVAEIPGGMVPLPDQMPEAFAAAVAAFLERG
jgi:pimeloyl-ACP methyl ester carboxylesterase